MLFQEDIMTYFEFIAQELKNKNLPIFNNFIHEYPGFVSKDELEEESEDEEDLETA